MSQYRNTLSYPAGLAQTWNMLSDENYYQALAPQGKAHSQVLRQEKNIFELRLSLEIPSAQLNESLSSFLGAVVEIKMWACYEYDGEEITGRIELEVEKIKVKIAGTVRIYPGEDDLGKREDQGEIICTMPFLGARIQTGLAENISKIFGLETAGAQKYLQSQE